MVTCSISNRVKPPLVTSLEPVGMIGARSADSIKASGQIAPRKQAGHMTAPDQGTDNVAENSCTVGAVHT